MRKRTILLLISAIAALFFIFFTYLSYRRDLRAAYRRLEGMERQILQTPCGPIEVAVRGQGLPILSIHGSAGGFDHALAVAAPHLNEGYQVIAPSRFGYLGTPLPAAATPQTQADAFVCVLDKLGVEKTAVIATSAGGPSALQLALNYPERVSALVMMSTAVTDKPLTLPPRPVMQLLGHSNFFFWLLTHPLRSLGQRMFIPAAYDLSAQGKAEVAALMESLLPISPRADGLIFDMYITNSDAQRNSAAYQLQDITVPTLVINAKDDPLANFADAKQMSTLIPQAQFFTVLSGGHIMAGSEDRIAAHIDRFLAENADFSGSANEVSYIK